ETTREGETFQVRGPIKFVEELDALGARLRFEVSSEAFFQVNTEMAERLYGTAAELAGLTGRERVFDLFSGIGTIALALATAAGEVRGIEVVKGAVEDANRNARLNAIDNASFAT